MNRINKCAIKHEELFKVKQTKDMKDPDFTLLLQEYLFGEVYHIGDLDNTTRELITCIILTTLQALPQLTGHLHALINTGMEVSHIKEAIYQCAPYLGFPRVLNALNTLNSVLESRELETLYEKNRIEENRVEYGNNILNHIGDTNIIKQYDLNHYQGIMENFYTNWCYTDTYNDTLTNDIREMIIIVIGITLNNNQLIKQHLKLFNHKEQIIPILIQCLPYVGFPSIINVLELLKEMNYGA